MLDVNNPSEINCILPLHFRSNSSQIETVSLLFPAVTVRTTLMVVACAAYLVVLAVSAWVWFHSHAFVPGILLLRKIGPAKTQRILKDLNFNACWFSFDLHLLMGLAYVNRNRLQYLQ